MEFDSLVQHTRPRLQSNPSGDTQKRCLALACRPALSEAKCGGVHVARDTPWWRDSSEVDSFRAHDRAEKTRPRQMFGGRQPNHAPTPTTSSLHMTWCLMPQLQPYPLACSWSGCSWPRGSPAFPLCCVVQTVRLLQTNTESWPGEELARRHWLAGPGVNISRTRCLPPD